MKHEAVNIRKEWDRLATYVLFIAYGLYSVFYPIISVERVVDSWIEMLLAGEFMFAGSIMIYGLVTDRYPYWRIGMVVATIGLLTISLTIASVGGARVLAYAFLFGSFAAQCVYKIGRAHV